MNNKTGSGIELEILIATMNRNSLHFLDAMFINNDISKLHILIVNQTSKNCLLKSEKPNIRVVNSFDKGISKSRNLALKNAIGDICLLADDDVVYLEGFEEVITNAFKSQKDIDVITFKTLTTDKIPYYEYPNGVIDVKQFYKKVLSIEIAFVRDAIITNNIIFDEFFGLGSVFEDGENRFFLKEIFSKKLKALFVPEFIVIHKPFSSSDDVTSDRYFYARSAMFYKSYGILAYFYIVKLIFSLLRKGVIPFKDVLPKYRIAINGVKKYKELNLT